VKKGDERQGVNCHSGEFFKSLVREGGSLDTLREEGEKESWLEKEQIIEDFL
jgi:hypothetical protein